MQPARTGSWSASIDRQSAIKAESSQRKRIVDDVRGAHNGDGVFRCHWLTQQSRQQAPTAPIGSLKLFLWFQSVSPYLISSFFR
jgi:hypothetical protein